MARPHIDYKRFGCIHYCPYCQLDFACGSRKKLAGHDPHRKHFSCPQCKPVISQGGIVRPLSDRVG